MRRLIPLLAALAIALGACASVESSTMPDCDLERASAVLLVAQSVPTAELIPCVRALPPGWSLTQLDAHSGETTMRFNSDRLGSSFLEVTLLPRCAPITSEPHVVAGGMTWLSRNVEQTAPTVAAAIVTLAPRHTAYAVALAAELRSAGVPADVPGADEPASSRIEVAEAAGRHIVVVDDELRAAEHVELRRPDGSREVLDTEDVVAELTELVEEGGQQTFRGSWQFRFEGGCATYAFDAAGPGAGSLGATVEEALSFVSRNELRRFTWDRTGLPLDG